MAQTLPPPPQLPPIQAGTTFTVTTNTDTNDGVCDDHCTLREAILAANASPNGALPASRIASSSACPWCSNS